MDSKIHRLPFCFSEELKIDINHMQILRNITILEQIRTLIFTYILRGKDSIVEVNYMYISVDIYMLFWVWKFLFLILNMVSFIVSDLLEAN